MVELYYSTTERLLFLASLSFYSASVLLTPSTRTRTLTLTLAPVLDVAVRLAEIAEMTVEPHG